MHFIRAILFLSFFLSGFSSLVYEVTWTRELTLVLGGATSALAAILSAFMVGLALGSLLIGRKIDHWATPVKVFGLLELAIGVGGLLLGLFLPSLGNIFALLYRYFAPGSHAVVALRFLGAFVLLLLPTLAMGATFPAIVRTLTASAEDTGRTAGKLYALNVAGSVFGALFTGIYALENLGALQTLYWATGINLLIGLFACLSPLPASPPAVQPSTSAKVPETGGMILILIAISGLTGLGYEQAYHRLMVFTVGNSIYGLTILLAVFLGGMALGSYIGSRFSQSTRARRSVEPLFGLGLVELGLAVAAPLSLMSLHFLPDLLPLGASFWSDFGWRSTLAFFAMAPVALLLGASFPLAIRSYIGRESRIGAGTAHVYAANTFGAVLGPPITAFVLIPWLGIKGSMLALAALNLGIGILLIRRYSPWKRFSQTLAYSLPLLATALTLFLTGNHLKTAGTDPQGESLFYHEGKDSTVEIYQDKNNPYYRWLSINGAVEVTIDYTSLQTFKVLGHLPLLLHRDPQEILMVSLGAGIVLGAVTRHPVRSIDCVEISSGAVKAQPFFEKENYGAIQDKRVNLVVDDARSYLLGAPKQYDVILMDATHPSSADSWVLYTREYYELCKRKLAEGGLIAQWLPLHQISGRDYTSIIRTFRSVFPYITLWCTYRHTILLGALSPIRLDMDRMIERMQLPAVDSSLAEVGLNHPFVLANCLLMGEQALARFSEENRATEINTDDRAPVQFSESRQYPRDTRVENLRQVMEYRESPFPYLAIPSQLQKEEEEAFREAFQRFEEVKVNNVQGVLAMETGGYASAVEIFRNSLEAIPEDADSRNLLNLAKAAYSEQTHQFRARAKSLKQQLSTEEKTQVIEDLLRVGALQLRQGRQEQAFEAFQTAREIDPDNPRIHHYLGLAYLEEKRFKKASGEWRRAVELDPDYAEAHNFLAVAYYFAREYLLAVQHCDRAQELGYPVQPSFLKALKPHRLN